MNKSIRRALSLLILTCMVFTAVLTGCGSSKEESTGNTTDDGTKLKEFTAFFAVPGKIAPENNRVMKAIEEKTGVKVTMDWLTGQTAKERIGVLIAGGEYPDFIDGSDGTQNLIAAGALVPLDDYIDKYPNIKNYLGDDWTKMKNPTDGHIYYIPQFGIIQGEQMNVTHNDEAFWIQKAVLEWDGYPTIKTLDQYFDLIERYKAANPTINGQPTIGFEIISYDWRYFALENPPQFVAGYPNDGAAIVDKDTLTAINYNTIPEAKEYFKKINEVYNKGLVDKETFTANYDQYISKLSTGRVLGMVDQGWQFLDAEASLKKQGLFDRTYVPLSITLSEDIKGRYQNKPVLNVSGGLAITTSCDDVEGALQYINDLLGPEIEVLRTWGQEGIDYQVDENGVFYRNEEQRANAEDPDWVQENTGSPLAYFPHHEGMTADGKNALEPKQQPDEYFATLNDVDQKLLNAYGYKKSTDFLEPAEEPDPWFPIYTYNFEPNAPETIAKQKMDDIKRKWLPKVIMTSSSDFEKVWEEYQSALKNGADIKAYEDALTKEVQRRVELWK